jgi:hypothetical protein
MGRVWGGPVYLLCDGAGRAYFPADTDAAQILSRDQVATTASGVLCLFCDRVRA